jgi:thiol:disulfide interchange protein DsbD
MCASFDLEALMLRLLWSIVMLTMWWALPAHAQQDFLQPKQAFRLNIVKQADGQLRLNWEISKGYYLYRKQMKVEGDPVGSVHQIKWPAGTLKTDETFGESEVYHDKVAVLVTAPDAQALTIGWQGCAGHQPGRGRCQRESSRDWRIRR